MDTSQYDEKIQAALDERASLQEQLEKECLEHIRICTEFIKADYKDRIESSIIKKTEITKTLGLEKLRELKGELTAIIDRAPELVSEQLDKPSAWDHRNPLPENYQNRYNISFIAKKNVSEGLHAVLGHVGQLLIKYGFEKAGSDSAWEILRGTELPRYRYGMTYNEQIQNSMDRYEELFYAFVKTQTKIDDLQREKEEAIAKDLWNQA